MAHTEIYTLITRSDGRTQLLYSAEEPIKVRLTLETAGPVSIGTRENLGTPLSGGGVLLITNEEMIWNLPRGDRLYYVAGSVNRVKVSTEPIPYGQQVLDAIGRIISALGNLFRGDGGSGGGYSPSKPPPCPPNLGRR